MFLSFRMITSRSDFPHRARAHGNARQSDLQASSKASRRGLGLLHTERGERRLRAVAGSVRGDELERVSPARELASAELRRQRELPGARLRRGSAERAGCQVARASLLPAPPFPRRLYATLALANTRGLAREGRLEPRGLREVVRDRRLLAALH